MSSLLLLARDEWRYWSRSTLATWAAGIFALLLISTAIVTFVRIEQANHIRQHHQQEAENVFLSQPDRHPHRMVHYGHYAFRTPSPLSVFDPGLDAVTGQSIFLEGHRQNSAMFAEDGASANLGGFAQLSPALVYQLFGPLLIVLLGHAAVARERESATLATILAQGTTGLQLMSGKAVAMLSVIIIMLVPMAITLVFAVVHGASFAAASALMGIYLIYLMLWALGTLAVSAVLPSTATVLATLTALWLVLTLLLPSMAVTNTARVLPIPGKLETDLLMLEDLRQLGDGHNAQDPAFARLRAELLEEYGVASVEALPVNLRGIVAQYSEKQLTDTLNAYAEQRMMQELEQANLLTQHGWLTPVLALAAASRSISASDLANYHRFLRESEALRFEFVQRLNEVHTTELSYSDDINRSSDAQAEQRTRVTSEHWDVLESFEFVPDGFSVRLGHATSSVLALACWLLVMFGVTILAGKRLSV
ncbi:MAG: DUF3526 domain-containing protein [Pseudomonadota bacterium]